MSNPKGIARLVDIKRRACEAAEVELAAAVAAVTAAERERIEADMRWLASVEAYDHVGLMSDLETRDFHLRCLRRAVDEAEQRLILARSYEATARQAMTEARVEVKRFETWNERVATGRAEEAKRLARIADDEVAARKAAAVG